MKRLEGYRNFCNKIWNAARYVLMNTEDQDCGQTGNTVELSLADRWIISALQRTEATVTRQLDDYRFDLAAQTIYDFIWNQYCDWYLELSKPVLWDENAAPEALRGTRRTLVRVLEAVLRLAHPLMPYITEEIWQSIKTLAGSEGDTIMLQPYPAAEEGKIDTQAEADIEWLQGVITGIRNIRGEMKIPPSKDLDVLFTNGSSEDQRRLADNASFLKKLAKLSGVTWLNPGDEVPMAATALVGEMEVLVPMAGLIDKGAELARLQKELDRLQGEIKRVEGKLSNAKFVANAPDEVVAKEREKIAESQSAFDKLSEQYAKIEAL
jgi:valyl-tRNA synthetase